MNQKVENSTSTCALRVQPPAQHLDRERARVHDATPQWTADLARKDGVAHGAMGGGVAQVMICRHYHARCSAGLHHFGGIFVIGRKRFFAQDVLAGASRRHALLIVTLVRGRDVDRVHSL